MDVVNNLSLFITVGNDGNRELIGVTVEIFNNFILLNCNRLYDILEILILLVNVAERKVKFV
jgi:hypothetical protein